MTFLPRSTSVFWASAGARTATVYASKGIGEPPVHLATAVWTACKDAIGSIADHKFAVRLDPPMTPERVLFAIQEIKQQGDVGG